MNTNQIDLRQMNIPEDYCDCRFFCFRILLSRYGFFPSEEDMFGMGEGLTCQLMNVSALSTKIYCPIGRNMNFETAYGEKAGISLQARYFTSGSVEEIISVIRQKIDAGDPIVANVDRYYLDYLSVQRAHVGYHTILIFGYDDITRTLLILDGLTGSRVIGLSYEVFQKAVMSNCAVSTNQRWYCVEGKSHPLKTFSTEDIRNAIRNTCQRVLSEVESAHGFAEAMKRYTAAGDNPQIRKFLDIQSNVFFSSFHDQDRSRSFYRKTFLSFLNFHKEVFPDVVQNKIQDAGEKLLESIQAVHESSRQGAGQGMLAFEMYIRKEQALHQLLMFALTKEQENQP